MTDFEYKYELDDTFPRFSQPSKILTPLKAHQLAGLSKAVEMEKKGCIKYVEDNGDRIDVKTNIGIFGDIVGYGKTLTALALISASPLDDIKKNLEMNVSYCSNKNYSYLSYSRTNKNILFNNKIINSTLIVVPRGPVYIQWEKSLKNYTTLKYIAIDNITFIKKHLPDSKKTHEELIQFFNQYDVVLIKNTTLELLVNYYASVQTDDTICISIIKRWKRIMIDEAHDICNSISLMYYEYLWLITGTYENLLYSHRSHRNIIYNMRDAFNFDTLRMILVKSNKDFVRDSFKIPVPNEKYYLCKMPSQMNAIKNLICTAVLEKINANDIEGAIRDLGGKSDTKDNVIELVSNEIKRDIQNKELEKEYVTNLDIPPEIKASRLKTIETDIQKNKTKLDNLTERILDLNTKMCSICMYDIEHPIILECTHSYCATCIVTWINKNMNCPECRHKIDTDKMISVVNEKGVTPTVEKEQIYSKMDTLLNIIQQNPNGKYLVFSKYDHGFLNIIRQLDSRGISSSELKGNTSHMMNVLEKFKRGQLKVILLNTNFAGSGIDISFATDVIIFHSMGLAKYQAIGRAQRVGRTDKLNIHHLCYDHEMNNQ